MNISLVKKIDRMAQEDQKIRKGHRKGSVLDINVARKHTAQLKKIIGEYGWPTIPLVGEKSSFNAWLLAQHADHDIKFQQRVLALLRIIDQKSGDVDRAHIAYLTDRILVAKKKKQIFGTQFSFDKSGKLKLDPIKNTKKVDSMRREYNLPPLKDFTKMAEEFNTNIA